MTTVNTDADINDAPILLRHDSESIATLGLNRPQSGNSLSHASVAALQAALDDIAEDPNVRVVVLAGAGKHFCTGHDLNESLATKTGAEKRVSNAACNAMMQTIVALPQPVIARVHGTATASGCELAASCDLIVAADVARFATPGVNIGFWCYTPQVALSRVVGRKPAMEMLLTGDLISAEEALRIGLVNRVVPLADLDAAVTEIRDRFGIEAIAPDKLRMACLIGLLAVGHRRIMVSHDTVACWLGRLTPDWQALMDASPRWTYTHLFENIFPELRKSGVGDGVIRMLTVDNPRE